MSNLSINSGDNIAAKDAIRGGQKVVPLWLKRGGLNISAFPDTMFSMNRLCKVVELSDPATERQNEREHFNVGKKKIPVNDGITTTFTLTGEGNAYSLYAALKGQDLRDAAGIAMGVDIASAGDLVLVEADDSGGVKGSTYIPNCTLKFSTMPGATDGDSNLEIEISTTSTAWRFGSYVIPIREIWKDPVGSTTNTAAPDGSITAFTLGDGNNSGVSTLTPLAVKFNPDGSGADQHILAVYTDSTLVSSSAYTYNSSTGVLTFTTAPADGAALEGIYCLRVGAPKWEAKEYGIGSIVLGSNGTYYRNASAVAASSDDPADGTPVAWAAYTGWDVGGSSNPVIPFSDGSRTDMFKSLNELVETM